MYELFFRRGLEVDQPDAVAAAIASLGLSGSDYLDYFGSAGKEEWANAQQEASEDHVFDVLLFFFKGEAFWGHDRLPLLEQRLTESGLPLTE